MILVKSHSPSLLIRILQKISIFNSSDPSLAPLDLQMRKIGTISFVATLLMLGGCATDVASGNGSESGTAKKAVPSSNVSRVQAWKDAEMIAGQGEGRTSAAGSGGSMQPVFGDNTMIVVTKIAYDELKIGMTVAYLNRKGHQVVHQLTAKTGAGWHVQGLNNEVEDTELVTKDNLLGVVYASFSTEEP
jgi:hypothetical protein